MPGPMSPSTSTRSPPTSRAKSAIMLVVATTLTLRSDTSAVAPPPAGPHPLATTASRRVSAASGRAGGVWSDTSGFERGTEGGIL